MSRTERPQQVVMKFGGSSVSDRASWEKICEQVLARQAEGYQPVIVHSAITGVTGQLDNLLTDAVAGGYARLLEDISARHLQLAADMDLDGETLLHGYLSELEKISAGIALVGEVGYRLQARVLAFGELMATTRPAESGSLGCMPTPAAGFSRRPTGRG